MVSHVDWAIAAFFKRTEALPIGTSSHIFERKFGFVLLEETFQIIRVVRDDRKAISECLIGLLWIIGSTKHFVVSISQVFNKFLIQAKIVSFQIA